jgi:hypothetical protein
MASFPLGFDLAAAVCIKAPLHSYSERKIPSNLKLWQPFVPRFLKISTLKRS